MLWRYSCTLFGVLAAIAYERTRSLYAPMLAHVLNNTGPALAAVLPREMMPFVFLVTAELCVMACCRFSSGS
jgi:membrane protease YdiL (CAAX protease family)